MFPISLHDGCECPQFPSSKQTMNAIPWLDKIRNLTRSGEWLAWKIPLFLTVALLFIHISGRELDWGMARLISHLLIGVALGSVFVSVLNDFTDLDDDRRAGKSNRMEPLKPLVRYLLLALSIAGVSLYIVYGVDFWASKVWYLAACLSFVCYSAPPFRVKNRLSWGGLADALGSSLFPMLFLASEMTSVLGFEMSAGQWVAMSIWSLMNGLRGILWHQYRDLEADKSIGSRTFATENRLMTLRILEPLLVVMEMTSFLFFVPGAFLPIMIVLLAIHLVVVFLSNVLLGVRHTMVISEPGREEYALFGTFYQILCPAALVFSHTGWSISTLCILFVLFIVVLPDLRINYYLVKRFVYANRTVRRMLRERDALRRNDP